MKQHLNLLVVIILFIASGMFNSCTDSTVKTDAGATAADDGFSLDSVKLAIAESNKKFGETFANGDSTGFVNLYTSDACISPSSMPKMCGQQALSGFFNAGYKMGIRQINLSTEEVSGGKDVIAEVGSFEILGGKNISMDRGKYIVIWKQEGGKWKMHRDIWNSDLPAK